MNKPQITHNLKNPVINCLVMNVYISRGAQLEKDVEVVQSFKHFIFYQELYLSLCRELGLDQDFKNKF